MSNKAPLNYPKSPFQFALKEILENSANIAFILAALFLMYLIYIYVVEYDLKLFSLIGFLFFMFGFAFFFFWMSAIITNLLIWVLRKVPLIAFSISISAGICLGLLGLKFTELFFAWDLYVNLFIALGVLGGCLVFYFQRKSIQEKS